MQLRLPIPDTHHPTVLFSLAEIGTGDASAETEIGRLQAELARVASQQAKYERKRAKYNGLLRKARDRQQSLALQLDSLKRNPLAIGRYRSTLPKGIAATLWYDKPTSELKLETLSAVGSKRLKLLYDLCPTVGDLEIMRTYEGLTTIPGLSRLTVARIEKRLFAWLVKYAWDYEPMPSAECVRRNNTEQFPRVI